MRLPQRPLLHALLALLLLLTQYGAVLHGLDHAMDSATRGDAKELPRSAACERCLAHVALDAAAPARATALPLRPAAHARPALPAAPALRTATASGYRARAPPTHA